MRSRELVEARVVVTVLREVHVVKVDAVGLLQLMFKTLERYLLVHFLIFIFNKIIIF